MGGGVLMELAATNAFQSKYLYDNSNSYFNIEMPGKTTNFTIETIKVPLKYSDINDGFYSVLPRNGDLIRGMWIEMVFPVPVSYEIDTAFDLIEYVELRLYQQRLDKMTGEYMKIHKILNDSLPKESSTLFLSENKTTLQNWLFNGNDVNDDGTPCLRLMIPIPKWFDFKPFSIISAGTDNTVFRMKLKSGCENVNCNLLVDYVYLDTLERRKLGKPENFPISYLFHGTDHFQVESLGSNNNQQHCVSIDGLNSTANYVVFTVRDEMGNDISFQKAVLLLNGHERFEAMSSLYFNELQPLTYLGKTLPKHLYFFSHCLKPNEYKHSHSMAYDRFDYIKWIFSFSKPVNKIVVDFYFDTNILVEFTSEKLNNFQVGETGIPDEQVIGN